MTDDDLIEPYAVPEFFVDNFTKHISRDGVMTCVGYRKMPEGKVVVIRLAWPAVNTDSAIEDATIAMNTPVKPVVVPHGGGGAKRKAH